MLLIIILYQNNPVAVKYLSTVYIISVALS